jgi:CHAT domain-containing protein
LSGLVLSLVDADGRPRQGLLTAPDVSSLRLGAELVVLSSCRSAAGREVRGEGLVGLTRAFMDAGAPRVVASLWPVDDVASSELMTRMYRGMLGPDQASPAAALRKAQLRMLRHPRWKAPYYWAGFQLQGEWR